MNKTVQIFLILEVASVSYWYVSMLAYPHVCDQVMRLAETQGKLAVQLHRGLLISQTLAANLASIDLAELTEICPRMCTKNWSHSKSPSFLPQVCAI